MTATRTTTATRTMTATHTTVDSPLGDITLVAEAGALTGIYFDAHKHAPDRSAFGVATSAGFERASEQLREYFAGERTEFALRLAARGDAFQKQVWEQLLRIPYGETRSYGQLAEELGDRGLARAVGAANGRNPLSVVVPCHRVIGADGNLVGYGGGLDRKRFLLELETSDERKSERLF